MYSKISSFILHIITPLLVIAIIGGAYWGYQENQEKNALLIKAENQYQRAFHELNFHIEKLHEELGKSLVVNSREQLTRSLVNVWRLAYSAQNDLGQLPLSLMEFSKTEEFLSNISNFAYSTVIRDLNQEPLTDHEFRLLNTLYKSSNEIKDDLYKVQEKVIDNKLRWMDVELALATEDKQMDNTIIDGFKLIDKKVTEYSELDWDQASSMPRKNSTLQVQKLNEAKISESEAKKQIAEILSIKNSNDIVLEKNGKGANYNVFSARVSKDKESINVDITEEGGHIIWLLKEREVKGENISFDEAKLKAIEFLKKLKITNMEVISIDKLDNTVTLTLIYVQSNVRIYPDILTVKVALDNGEILGYQGTNYIINHHKRTIPNVKLTKNEVEKRVSKNMKIEQIYLAIIKDDFEKEKLAYEFVGKLQNESYRIYIDAENGREILAEKIRYDKF